MCSPMFADALVACAHLLEDSSWFGGCHAKNDLGDHRVFSGQEIGSGNGIESGMPAVAANGEWKAATIVSAALLAFLWGAEECLVK